jgi:serine/threonine protein kinase/tetratricopeptide (TPR) repeat protein
VISEASPNYQILEKLSEGADGEVYLAEDTRLGREVVLKLLPASYGYDPDLRAKFLSAASAAASLRSPNIAMIYDLGEQDDRIFVVMERALGELLSDKLKRGPLSAREAIDLAMQAADALDVAHSRDVIHGDIRSSNLIITERGLLKVLGFGLSAPMSRRRKHDESDDGKTVELGQDTVVDFLSIDVSYMSPEHALGQGVDARSDIFSLGVVIYEMIAGRLPFEGQTSTEIVEKIIRREPTALTRINTAIPLELSRIARKCMEKERERRYQSARELVIDLKNLKRDTGSGEMRAGAAASKPTTALRKRATGPRRQSRKRVTSLAVLPLENASRDANTEYLSDGITESLINSLSQFPRLRVMARSTVFRFKRSNNTNDSKSIASSSDVKSALDPLRAGAELGVDAVLTGRVLLRGDNLIINVELVNVEDGSHLWGQQYNRQLADIFTIQEGIAREITENLRLRLTGEEKKRLKKRYTDNTEAYQLYLKGRYYWNRRTEEGLKKGIEHFKLAIEADPVYALAYAGLADCYTMMCWHTIVPAREIFPKAKAAALQALELDEQLAEAHASWGAVSETIWDWASAEAQYRRALELNPNYATAHQWYAEYLAHIGRFDEAFQEMKKAQELDPLSCIINTELGWMHYASREYAEAIEQYNGVIDLDPDFAIAHWRLGEAYEQTGMYDEAIAEIQEAARLSGRSPHIVSRLGHAYAVAGRKQEALEVLHELNGMSKQQYVSPYEIAIIYAGLGEKDLVFEWLERAYEDCSSWLTFLKVEPSFDAIKSDPRFIDLIRRIGLPE